MIFQLLRTLRFANRRLRPFVSATFENKGFASARSVTRAGKSGGAAAWEWSVPLRNREAFSPEAQAGLLGEIALALYL